MHYNLMPYSHIALSHGIYKGSPYQYGLHACIHEQPCRNGDPCGLSRVSILCSLQKCIWLLAYTPATFSVWVGREIWIHFLIMQHLKGIDKMKSPNLDCGVLSEILPQKSL